MNFIQAIEAEYAALRAFGHKDGDLGARLIALVIITGQLFPVAFVMAKGLPYWVLASVFAGMFLTGYAILDVRRSEIAGTYWCETWRPSQRQRWTLLAFMFVSTVSIALLSRFNAFAGLLAYAVTAALPLRSWVDGRQPAEH